MTNTLNPAPDAFRIPGSEPLQEPAPVAAELPASPTPIREGGFEPVATQYDDTPAAPSLAAERANVQQVFEAPVPIAVAPATPEAPQNPAEYNAQVIRLARTYTTNTEDMRDRALENIEQRAA